MFLAKARGLGEGTDQETVVMVKALHSREEWAHADFKREMDMFHKLSHEGIARLLGVSRDVEPFLVIMEYTDWVSERPYPGSCPWHGRKLEIARWERV